MPDYIILARKQPITIGICADTEEEAIRHAQEEIDSGECAFAFDQADVELSILEVVS